MNTKISAAFIAMVFSATYLSTSTAYAYSFSTHSRIVEAALLAAREGPSDTLDLPANIDPGTFDQYLLEAEASLEQLEGLRVGLPSSRPQGYEALPPVFPPGADPSDGEAEQFPFDKHHFESGGTCAIHPEDNLANLDQFRVRDFRYVPEEHGPCGITPTHIALRSAPYGESGTDPSAEPDGLVLRKLLGWHAASIDHHLDDTVLWFRPTLAGASGVAFEYASRVVEYGLTAIAVPFVMLWKAFTGQTVQPDELARQINPVDYVQGWIPGVGEVRGDSYVGVWHFIHVDAATNRFNDTRGLWYEQSGPAAVPGALDMGIMLSSDLVGLTVNPFRADGVDRYGQYDDVSRGKWLWNAHTVGHTEFSAVDNLARFGWDKFNGEAGMDAAGLGWPLHAIGDVVEPHHVAGTTGWGHRPLEDHTEVNLDNMLFSGAREADQRAQLDRILIEGFRWWQEFRTGASIRSFIEDLAAETRSKVAADGDWAYRQYISVQWQGGDHDGANQSYANAADEQRIRGLLEDGAGASLAFLIEAASRAQDPGLSGDIQCPIDTHFVPFEGCVEGPAVVEEPLSTPVAPATEEDEPVDCGSLIPCTYDAECTSNICDDGCCVPVLE